MHARASASLFCLRAGTHLRPPGLDTHTSNWQSAAASRALQLHTRAQQATHTAMAAEPGTKERQSLKAQVRSLPGDPNLTITLLLGDRQRNMNRPKDEPLEKVIGRIRATVAPAEKKGGKRKKGPGQQAEAGPAPEEPAPAPMEVQLFQDSAASREVPASTANEEAWRAQLLRVGSTLYEIDYNPPTVEKASLPRRPMVGFPILPRSCDVCNSGSNTLQLVSKAASVRVMFATAEATRYSWSRKRQGSDTWQDTGCTDLMYTPQPEDQGCQLQVQCTPMDVPAHSEATKAERVGEPACAVSDIVEPAPARTSAQMRCAHTRKQPAERPAFRILSYNLLADQYAGSTYAQQVLFNYCPPAALDFDYRCQLEVQELLNYQGDILCLQEVDEKMFSEHLIPHLQRQGYDGHFTNKQGQVREGSATFWRTSRFQRLHTQDILLRDVFKQPLAPAHAQWQRMLDASPHLAQALQMVTTIAQATILQPVGENGGAPHPQERPLCIVNTHLFYHPYAPHIRAMHTAAILEEANALLQSLSSSGSHQLQTQPSLIFCGDLNSDLNDGIPGVVELLQNGFLPADHWDWYMGAEFRWGMNEEEGSTEQQASAPQPPNSAIAAAVAAAKESAAARSSSKPAQGAATSAAQAQPSDASAAAASSQSGALPVGGEAGKLSPQGRLQVTADDGHAFSANRTPTSAVEAPGIDVRVPFALRSADDLKTPFTNYTSGYKALLDYVWYQPDALEVVSTVPVPNEEEIGSFIPSPTFPSDHLAVVYDLRWKPRQ